MIARKDGYNSTTGTNGYTKINEIDATSTGIIEITLNKDECDTTFPEPKKQEPSRFIERIKKKKLKRWQRAKG